MKKVFLVSTVVLVVLLTAASQAAPNMRFTENFETGWANNGAGGVLGDLGDGALTNGWMITALSNVDSTTFPGPYPHRWTTAIDDAANHVLSLSPMFESCNHIGGKAHGLDISYATTHMLELSCRVAVDQAPGATKADIWFATQYQYGYGVSYAIDATGSRRLNIVKFVPASYSSNIAFGGTVAPFFFEKDGQGCSWLNVNTENPDSYAYNQTDFLKNGADLGLDSGFVTLHLRVEQAAAGQPVTLTAWHTSGNGIADSNYAHPDVTFVDDGVGAGGRFNSVAPYSNVIDLDTLGYIAFKSGGYIEGNPSSYIQLDAINVYNYAPDTTPKKGDITKDGKVDFTDFATFASQWQTHAMAVDQNWTEDYAGLANGAPKGWLSDPNAVLDGWKFCGFTISCNSLAEYVAGTVPDRCIVRTDDSFPAYWPGGKAHGLDLSNATSVTFSAKVAAKGLYSWLDVWLGQDVKYGYGFQYWPCTGGSYNNKVTIIKQDCSDTGTLYGGDGRLSERWDEFWSCYYAVGFNPQGTIAWNNFFTEGVAVGSGVTDFITFYVKLEQTAPGQPVKITLWHTGSNTADTSYASPDMVKWDGGESSDFTKPVYDIGTLTFIGFNNLPSTQAEANPVGSNYVKIGTLNVTAPGALVYPSADFDHSGIVDFNDLAFFLANQWLWQIDAVIK